MFSPNTLLLDVAPNPYPDPVPLEFNATPIIIGAVVVVLVVVAIIAIVRARKKSAK